MSFPFLIWADAKYADKVPNEATAAARKSAMEPSPCERFFFQISMLLVPYL